MSEKKADNTRLVTGIGRFSFPKVFKPEAFEEQTPKYSTAFLLPKKTDMGPYKAIIKNAKVAKWGKDSDNWPKNIHNPLKDGDEKDDLDGYTGMYYFTASNKNRPAVVDKDMNPITEESGDFYAGCYGRLAIRAFAYEVVNKKGQILKRGVSLSLEHIQKLKDGEPFSGKPKVEDVFEPVESDDDDSSGDDDDDF